MYLIFDAETTGLPKNWKAPVTDLHNWPRAVQLAWQLTDEEGEVLDSNDFIIRPEGFKIPKDAVEVHGITTEQAIKEGDKLDQVLQEFYSKVEESKCLVAHNIGFDSKVVGAEFLRKEFENPLHQVPQLCTMDRSTDFCCIPHPNGYGYKWPKLEELYYILFEEEMENAHDALADVEACKKCLFELKERGIL